MKKELLKDIHCINCGNVEFKIQENKSNKTELREGLVICESCGQEYEIKNGIINLSNNIDKKVIKEISQWEVVAKNEGWLNPTEKYLTLLPSPKALKYVPKDNITWHVHELHFNQITSKVNWNNKKVLDIGAGRCWSTKLLTLKGAKCVAIDVMDHKTIGLGAADVLMKDSKIFFERAIADMNDLPFKDEVFDIVFVSGSLHHTLSLEKTLRELSRVTKKGGKLLLTNEPSTWMFGAEVCKVEGDFVGINEHNFRFYNYIRYLRKAGYRKFKMFPYFGMPLFFNKFKILYKLYFYIKGGVILMSSTKNEKR